VGEWVLPREEQDSACPNLVELLETTNCFRLRVAHHEAHEEHEEHEEDLFLFLRRRGNRLSRGCVDSSTAQLKAPECKMAFFVLFVTSCPS